MFNLFTEIDKFSANAPSAGMDSMNMLKEEPSIENSQLTIEEVIINDNAGQFNYANEETSSNDTFYNSAPPNSSNVNSTEIQELKIQLLKKQIEVQELMAAELKAKIERTQQLMKMETAESELRCKEIQKRLES